MKRTINGFLSILSLSLMILIFTPALSPAQEGQPADTATVEGGADESSAFQDSVRFDDMDPIFYEAEEDEPVMKRESKGLSMTTIAIILVVALGIILVLIKKFAAKKK